MLMPKPPQATKPEYVIMPAENIFLVNFLDSSPLTVEEIDNITRTDPVNGFITNGWTHSDAPELKSCHARKN